MLATNLVILVYEEIQILSLCFFDQLSLGLAAQRLCKFIILEISPLI